jgi:phospholipid transport system substrate-binding protein
MRRILWVLWLILPAATLAQTGPDQVVEQTASALLAALDGRRDELKADPVALFGIVETHFLPRFDRAYAAFLVMGKHSRKASTDQKRRFTDALYNYMLRQYAAGLLEFNSDRLNVLPYKGKADAKRATVRTEVYLDDGTEVPVKYSLRLTDGGWKVYDVTIENISYIKNFRTQFGAEIQSKGLDAVIARLEADARESSGSTATEAAADAA